MFTFVFHVTKEASFINEKRGFTKKRENTKEAWKLKVAMELQSFADISSYPHEIHIQPLRCLLRLCRASGNGGTVTRAKEQLSGSPV